MHAVLYTMNYQAKLKVVQNLNLQLALENILFHLMGGKK